MKAVLTNVQNIFFWHIQYSSILELTICSIQIVVTIKSVVILNVDIGGLTVWAILQYWHTSNGEHDTLETITSSMGANVYPTIINLGLHSISDFSFRGYMGFTDPYWWCWDDGPLGQYYDVSQRFTTVSFAVRRNSAFRIQNHDQGFEGKPLSIEILGYQFQKAIHEWNE